MTRVNRSRSKRDISSAMARFLAVMGMDAVRARALAREAEAAERRERAEKFARKKDRPKQ
jgi:hypothetical protein